MHNNPTVATYDKYAHIYDQEVIDFWNNFPPEFITRFVTALPGKRVLSLGSGTGRDAIILRDRGLEVICVDASKTMVGITKGLGFESHCMTFAELGFPKESFDGVWAYTSLIHVPPHEAKKAVEVIYDFLKPSGAFAIGAMQGDTAGMVERGTMPGATRYFKKYQRQELRQLVEPCGLVFMGEQDYQPHNSVYLNQLYLKPQVGGGLLK